MLAEYLFLCVSAAILPTFGVPRRASAACILPQSWEVQTITLKQV